eukprot:12912461-Prorocentrum_lima.AAC.1
MNWEQPSGSDSMARTASPWQLMPPLEGSDNVMNLQGRHDAKQNGRTVGSAMATERESEMQEHQQQADQASKRESKQASKRAME